MMQSWLWKSRVIYQYFKRQSIYSSKKGRKVLNYRMYEKGVPFVNRGYTGGKKMGIKWEKAALNQQVKHINLALALQVARRH